MKISLRGCAFLLLAPIFAAESAETLLKQEQERTAELARAFTEQLRQLQEGILKNVKALEQSAKTDGDLTLFLWAHWVREDMRETDNGLHWLQEPVAFPPRLEQLREQWKTQSQRFVQDALQAEERRLLESQNHLEAHVRSLVRNGDIDEAVRARDLFAEHEKHKAFKDLHQALDLIQESTRPVARTPRNPEDLRTLPPDARVYFTGDHPAFQIFLKQVTAVSSGHLGLKATGIRLRGHPDLLGRRGLNVVAIYGADLLLHETFDSYRSEEESERFSKEIANFPLGTLVVVAAHDDATRKLTRDARAALYHLGAGDGLRRLRYRDAYLLIGIKGMAQGQAIERAGLGERVFDGREKSEP